MMRTIIGTAARGDTEMIQYLADLLELLQLEPLEHNLFRGLSFGRACDETDTAAPGRCAPHPNGNVGHVR